MMMSDEAGSPPHSRCSKPIQIALSLFTEDFRQNFAMGNLESKTSFRVKGIDQSLPREAFDNALMAMCSAAQGNINTSLALDTSRIPPTHTGTVSCVSRSQRNRLMRKSQNFVQPHQPWASGQVDGTPNSAAQIDT